MRIELLQVRNSPVENHCVVSLRKTLYPLLSPGSKKGHRPSMSVNCLLGRKAITQAAK